MTNRSGDVGALGNPGLSVLFADDNAVLRASVPAMLRALGHRTDVVRNGLEAVDAASRGEYDVVLLDVQMPVMGGLEAAGLIARGRGRRPRIVAVSADPGGEAVDGAFGIDAVLGKPLRLAALALALAGPGAAAARDTVGA
jgi:CheY-like chemotaxis protein